MHLVTFIVDGVYRPRRSFCTRSPCNLLRVLQGKKVPEDHADRGAWTRMQDARHGLPTLRPASARRGFARAGLLA